MTNIFARATGAIGWIAVLAGLLTIVLAAVGSVVISLNLRWTTLAGLIVVIGGLVGVYMGDRIGN